MLHERTDSLEQGGIKRPQVEALPNLPQEGTIMVRLLRISGTGLSDFFEPAFRALDLSGTPSMCCAY